jgi:hypothetical protein
MSSEGTARERLEEVGRAKWRKALAGTSGSAHEPILRQRRLGSDVFLGSRFRWGGRLEEVRDGAGVLKALGAFWDTIVEDLNRERPPSCGFSTWPAHNYLWTWRKDHDVGGPTVSLTLDA